MAHGLPQDFWGKVRSAPRRLLLLDYDGTLAPFHVSRMQARPSDATRELLHDIVAAGHTKVVIVSGRPARQVKILLDELPVEVFGAHGFERALLTGELRKQELSNEEISGLEEAKSVAAGAGLSEHIEVKPASVAIHVRGLDAQRTIEVEELAWNIYTPIAEKFGLECRAFNGGVEIRSQRFHKGLAIDTLAAEESDEPFVVYVGDDETDEDAFKALRSNGFGIKVGGHPSDTAARGYLPNQEEVLPFLRQWHQAVVSKDRIVLSDRSKSRLICVSNRLPSLEVNEQGERTRPIGGLATALEAALSQSEAGGLWMGWSGNISPEDDAHKLQEFGEGPIQLMAVDLTEREHEAYYNGFCNNTIWPLFHNFPTIAKLSSWQLEVYRAVNELFAQSLIDSLKDNDLVWAHDYHLMLLAKRLRAAGWRGRTGFFLHTPFPPLDTLAVLPEFQDFLKALLEFDLIGFQTQPYLDNYIYACRRALGAEWDGYVLRVGAIHQRAGVYPIGIDTQRFVPGPQSSAKRAEGRTLTETFGDRDIIIGVDRLDYTKGMPQRTEAFELLLQLHPKLKRCVSFVQVSSPSRTTVPEYQEQKRTMDALVGRINGELGDHDWEPIRYLYRTYTQDELTQFYRESRVGLVTPLRDGMNLVAKEYVAAQYPENPGALVLSRFAGAAEQLPEAILVNPFLPEDTAQGIARALEMPLAERQERHAAMLNTIRGSSVQKWAKDFLFDLQSS